MFVLVLDRVLCKALDGAIDCVCQTSGSRSPSEYVTDLSYADDIALFSTSFE